MQANCQGVKLGLLDSDAVHEVVVGPFQVATLQHNGYVLCPDCKETKAERDFVSR